MKEKTNKVSSFNAFLNEADDTTGANKFIEFKKELKALFEKYNASIDCIIEGDTHGLSTTMVAEIDKKDYIICHNSGFDTYDLK